MRDERGVELGVWRWPQFPENPMVSGPRKAPYPGHPDKISRISKLTHYTVSTAKWHLEIRLTPASICKEIGKKRTITGIGK